MVFMEGLRLHPALGAMQRTCVEDYNIPGTDLTVKKGEEVFFPASGLHADPDHYPEPEKFIPERFSKVEKENRHP